MTYTVEELKNKPGLYKTNSVQPDYLTVIPLHEGGFRQIWISCFDGSTEEAIIHLYD